MTIINSPAKEIDRNLLSVEAPLEISDNSDAHSTLTAESDGESSDGASLFSAASSVFDFVYENGRRYTNRRDGKYMLPNDEAEEERLNVGHAAFFFMLKGELHIAPVYPRRVLDLGTGTGCWAIDMGDLYPDAEIIGTDLSPIQPHFVPPNVHFEVDDFEDEEWGFSEKERFDLIHTRHLVGSVQDWRSFVRKCYDNLQPGGFLELHETDIVNTYSEDNSIKGSAIEKYSLSLKIAGIKAGRPMHITSELSSYLEEAGFINIVVRKTRAPIGTWPKDEFHKQLGEQLREMALSGLEAYGLATFTRVLGWSEDRARELIEDCKRDFMDRKVHTIYPQYFIYAQRPEI
ncbi:S-adenosyl-L-methionine-dependent methyltransferase [Ascobolus immersus RN42]|uniref:S-adenosyl-L-methionine-dependent methyltransferase n=1 Tax=Ascobolus immersus RN42 TaxID=1160509 RepID=A0A3N4IAQ9_ASCIM|nr:S-adenosyl-L-methionine-dependent methyltransferase [Ascobolus immersus RN42]